MDSKELVSKGRTCFDNREFELAYMLFQEAILLDHNGYAYYGLGRMYYYGNYVRKDRHRAFELYETADEMGADIPSAEYIFMGDKRKVGEYLEKDEDMALKWYKRATERGEEFGYECMGDIYFAGGDYEKAFECFSSVSSGSACAKYHLGYMYEKGLCVEQDLDKAVEYYNSVVLNAGRYERMDDHYALAKQRLAELGVDIVKRSIRTKYSRS